MCAVGGSGGRNEVRFFEADVTADDTTEENNGFCTGGFKSTYAIMDLKGGVQSLDFACKNNRIVIGTASGVVANFKLKMANQ